MLEGELDGHLDYQKHHKSASGNTRNGYSETKIKSSFGEDTIKVIKDRNGFFNPMIVQKRRNMVDDIENVIVSLYVKGMSNSDIEEQLSEIYNF
uniref:transposase n=1 Tax=Arenibacter lacus TaxID=2608629 RepID=UPI00168A8D5B